MNEVVEEVIASYGGVAQAQERFNYKHPQCVYNWRTRGLPGRYLLDIHLDTQIPVERLKQGVSQVESAA